MYVLPEVLHEVARLALATMNQDFNAITLTVWECDSPLMYARVYSSINALTLFWLAHELSFYGWLPFLRIKWLWEFPVQTVTVSARSMSLDKLCGQHWQSLFMFTVTIAPTTTPLLYATDLVIYVKFRDDFLFSFLHWGLHWYRNSLPLFSDISNCHSLVITLHAHCSVVESPKKRKAF